MIELSREIFLLMIEIPIVLLVVGTLIARALYRSRRKLKEMETAYRQKTREEGESGKLRKRIDHLERRHREDAREIELLRSHHEERPAPVAAPEPPPVDTGETERLRARLKELETNMANVAEATRIIEEMTDEDNGVLFDLLMQGNNSLGLLNEGRTDEATGAFTQFLQGLDRVSDKAITARDLLLNVAGSRSGGATSGYKATESKEKTSGDKPSAYYVREVVREDENHIKRLRSRIFELSDSLMELEEFRTKYPDLAGTIGRLQEANRQLELCIETLESENDRLMEELTQVRTENSDELKVLEEFNHQLEARIGQVEAELKVREAEAEKARDEYRRLEKELETFGKQKTH